MSRRGASSGGGASSLGYLFGSDATTLAGPNNRAPPRPSPDYNTGDHPGFYNNKNNVKNNNNDNITNDPQRRQQQNYYEQEGATGFETPAGYETPTGYQTPGGGDCGMDGSQYVSRAAASAAVAAAGSTSASRNNYMWHQPQTRAAGKVINDGGGVSLDMSGGSMGRDNNYFRSDGQNSGNFITGRPSTRVQAAPGGGSSLGYLFGGA